MSSLRLRQRNNQDDDHFHTHSSSEESKSSNKTTVRGCKETRLGIVTLLVCLCSLLAISSFDRVPDQITSSTSTAIPDRDFETSTPVSGIDRANATDAKTSIVIHTPPQQDRTRSQQDTINSISSSTSGTEISWVQPKKNGPPEWDGIQSDLMREICNSSQTMRYCGRKSGCGFVRFDLGRYCGIDGSACGATTFSSYDQHKRLRNLILGGRTVNTTIFGNSVARERNFATTRYWKDAVLKTTNTRLKMNYGHVKGGFELRHLLRCGGFVEQMEYAQLAILQFSHHEGKELEKAVRLLMQLPHKPVVVLISHCLMGDFSNRADWKKHRESRKIGEPAGWWENIRVNEEKIARHYGLSYMHTCPAFHTMFNRSDDDPLEGIAIADDLIRTFLPDCVHLNLLGAAMQACFLARLTLDQPEHAHPPNKAALEGRIPEPILLLPNDQDTSAFSKFCYSTAEKTLEPVSTEGWVLATGGAGGNKTWYSATGGLDSTLILRSASAHFLVMLVYTHPDLPLSRVRITVSPVGDKRSASDKRPDFYVDPCCEGAFCPGTGPNRGIYKEFRIPEEGYFSEEIVTADQIDISLIVTKRKENTKCSKEGTNFSLVSVVGMSV